MTLTLVLGQYLTLPSAIFFARMLADEPMAFEDSDAVVRSNDVNIVIEQTERDRVAVGVQGYETERIDGAMGDFARLVDMQRQSTQRRFLDREELPWGGAKRALVALIDRVAPHAHLTITVGDVREASSGVEVALDVVEVSLDAGRAVGIAEGVSDELEAEVLGKGCHLRGWHGIGPGTVGDDDAGVIEHASLGAALEVPQGLDQKDLTPEAIELRIGLCEQHA